MDKNKKAVAIKYDRGQIAPTIVGKGKGFIAEKILENAKDIPVYRDKKMVEELEKVDIGDYIPPELYEAVAQILVFISDLDKLKGKIS